MILHLKPIPYLEDWAEPSPRFLRKGLPPAPDLPLADIVAPKWATWIRDAAEAKSAPPILWTMLIGAPSSNKSPGLDAVLAPLNELERDMRKTAEADLAKWFERAEVAKIAQSVWKEATKAALKPVTICRPSPTKPIQGWNAICPACR